MNQTAWVFYAGQLDSYRIAVEEGANLVCIGTRILGHGRQAIPPDIPNLFR